MVQVASNRAEAIRKSLLVQWAHTMEKAAQRGVFSGQSIALRRAMLINGPRAGALELDAGLQAGTLLKALQANSGALGRQFVPWQFEGDPDVFMSGRDVHFGALWRKDLADSNIPLSALGRHPLGNGRWLVGRTDTGDALVAGLNDNTPHYLYGGTSGSGKSTGLKLAIFQLAQDPKNRLVLIDAKHGVSLAPVANVRGRVGPLAGDIFTARAALTWCVKEMARRYSEHDDERRLIIVIDEVQDIVTDPVAAEALRLLVAQGRGAHVHVLVATQHPIIKALGGPMIGRNLAARVGFRVMDRKASEVMMGGPFPRADLLGGRGDLYFLAPGMVVKRAQGAYIDSEPPAGPPEMVEWPTEDVELPELSSWPSGAEVGAALLSASLGEGRKLYQDRCAGSGFQVGDNNRAVRLVKLARGAVGWLEDNGASVCLEGEIDIETEE